MIIRGHRALARLRCTRMLHAVMGVVLCTAVLTSDVEAKNKDGFFAKVGRSIGRPFGAFVDSVTTPSIRTAESAASGLISEIDDTIDKSIARAGATTERALATADRLAAGRIDQADAAVAARISQADSVMAARITQLDLSANQVVDRAIGGLSATVRQSIVRLDQTAQKSITRLDDVARQRLEQADRIVEARIVQLDSVVRESIADVDRTLESRLDQLDHLSERRVGNLDVIATRQVLNTEGALARFLKIAAVVVFVVFVLRSLAREIWQRWEREIKRRRSQAEPLVQRAKLILTRNVWENVARVLFAHVVIGGVGAGLLLVLLAKVFPDETEARHRALVARHTLGFEGALRDLDYERARYFASQLTILVPESSDVFELRADKLRAIQNAMSRPGILQRPEATRRLARDLEALDTRLARQLKIDDAGWSHPDIAALKCFVLWQLARTRSAEKDAAGYCSDAIRTHEELKTAGDEGSSLAQDFILAEVAAYYENLYRYQPHWQDGEVQAFDPDPASWKLEGFQHVTHYAKLVTALDTKTTHAYLALLDAQAKYNEAESRLDEDERPPSVADIEPEDQRWSEAQRAVVAAKRERQQHAQTIVDAWQRFDSELTSDAFIPGSNIEYAVFRLNDALLSRALYVVAAPDAHDLPKDVASIDDLMVRVRAAPIRIEWARRYLNPLSSGARSLAQHEEFRRFEGFQERVAEFEAAFLELKDNPAGTVEPELRERAAHAAAKLGLYVSDGRKRRPYATVLLQSKPAPDSELAQALDETNLKVL